MLSPTKGFVKAFGRTAAYSIAIGSTTPSKQGGLFEWKYVLVNESFPHCQEVPIIDGKDLNSGSANCRFARKCGSCPHEVSIPLVLPWMKESNKFACVRISAGYVRTFAPFSMQVREARLSRTVSPPVGVQ